MKSNSGHNTRKRRQRDSRLRRKLRSTEELEGLDRWQKQEESTLLLYSSAPLRVQSCSEAEDRRLQFCGILVPALDVMGPQFSSALS